VTEASDAIPFISGSPGLIDLGPTNPSAIKRLANYAQAIVKSGAPMPESPFIEWAADRVTGTDRQDLVFFLQGRRGSGKSYSCLWIGTRLGEAISKRKGGDWRDYFSLKNVAVLEDSERIMQLLNTTGKYQVVLIDDAALAISNRSWNSAANRNFNALLSICRTRRWILLLTAPLKKQTDNQVRELCDINGTVYRSFHKGGFNILKITSSEISTSGKEYNHRLSFDKKKVDFWVTFKPDPELSRDYDIERDKSAHEINARIVKTGSFMSEKTIQLPLLSVAERNTEAIIKKDGNEIRKFMQETPGVSINKIAAQFGLSYQKASQVVSKIKSGDLN
jgi:hypothetical protein